MVNAMFGGRDPAAVVPMKYRPARAKPREYTPEEREFALEAGYQLVGNMLRQMTQE
ncbi:MAG TPA: hypothetical protein VD866_01065 [Urbifossiella sp.]|nr:hypothetical protein [Urbifossiella sp.]